MNVSSRAGGDKPTIFLVVVLVALIAVVGVAAVYITTQAKHESEYLATASGLQLLSQRMATLSLEAASGTTAAFDQLGQERDAFDALQKRLKKGDPAARLPAAPAEIASEVNAVDGDWQTYRRSIDSILAGQETISTVAEYVEIIRETMPFLLETSDEVVSVLVDNRAPQQQVYIATRQLMIAQRMENSLNRVLAGTEASATAAGEFGNDARLFGEVLEGFANGSEELGIRKLTNVEVREALREVAVAYAVVKEQAEGIIESSTELSEINVAASGIESQGALLLSTTQSLETAIRTYGSRLELLMNAAGALAAASLIVLILIGWRLVRGARIRAEESAAQNNRNQQAILRLLDEMATLADGDLTAHATVTEDITGAIADSVNFSIDALRSLVTTINDTSERVSTSADRAQHITSDLSEASNTQAREIAAASAAVVDMADSIEQVSRNAGTSADVAQRAVDFAHGGTSAVSRTIDGMGTIREQIQETSKRIKRLGESSQEIGDIVGLINEIADQTNILALNAAIQAATAGEAGRGFAVVADEVQRLAERAGNATKQIEVLVKTIQTDTNEAVISMEQSTANVVAGAKLAEDAGESLQQIENVSTNLSELIQSISQSARQQATSAANITNTMNVIQEITMQTSAGTTETADSVGTLTELSTDLKESVAGFKLPESDEADMQILAEEPPAESDELGVEHPEPQRVPA
ncbi:MAG: methyl-accepting chemotaxis protein [Pseudomonadota bacterium]|nr:methyl-accepting chemotaxis protein [Pseudomonadota bacterium]